MVDPLARLGTGIGLFGLLLGPFVAWWTAWAVLTDHYDSQPDIESLLTVCVILVVAYTPAIGLATTTPTSRRSLAAAGGCVALSIAGTYASPFLAGAVDSTTIYLVALLASVVVATGGAWTAAVYVD
ncbi:MAG: hypothetical protein AAF548_05285 [Actinomycetota bacterium]